MITKGQRKGEGREGGGREPGAERTGGCRPAAGGGGTRRGRAPPGSACGAPPTSSARRRASAPPSTRSLCSSGSPCAIPSCSRTLAPSPSLSLSLYSQPSLALLRFDRNPKHETKTTMKTMMKTMRSDCCGFLRPSKKKQREKRDRLPFAFGFLSYLYR